MANATFNAGIDYFGLQTATSNAVKVTASNENKSKQSTSGANSYGDAIVVDAWGETAAPSSDYQVVAEIEHALDAQVITLGKLISAQNSQIKINISGTPTDVPVVVGSLTISTQNGSAPTMSVSGQAVQTGAAELRNYTLPAFTLSPRHRAQDFLGLCTIKKGSSAASPVVDYGLESCNAAFPIEFTLGQPKGNLLTYDIHGGMVTVDYTMNWYSATAPTIDLAASITLALDDEGSTTTTVTPTMTTPETKACPEGGYTQYTWQVSFALIGFEVEAG